MAVNNACTTIKYTTMLTKNPKTDYMNNNAFLTKLFSAQIK